MSTGLLAGPGRRPQVISRVGPTPRQEICKTLETGFPAHGRSHARRGHDEAVALLGKRGYPEAPSCDACLEPEQRMAVKQGETMIGRWAEAQRLLGRWEGPATGRPGTGQQVREYRSILQGRFIQGTDETRWVPTPQEPAGLFHEDLAVLGWEAAAGQLTMRSFHAEGFVHDYRCVDAASDGSRLVFEADQVENGPPGMRARETLLFNGPDDLESSFELAMPGGDFEPYTHEQLHRTLAADG